MEVTKIIDIPKGYEFVGIDDDKQQIILQRITAQYPATFEECLSVLGLENHHWNVNTENVLYGPLLEDLQALLLCRDAYWKLSDNWEPDWDSSTDKFCIENFSGDLEIGKSKHVNHFLCFPTKEARNTFFENFKPLIWECRELL